MSPAVWTRLVLAKSAWELTPKYIDQPLCESFNGRLRDELLNSRQWDSLLETRVIIEDWRIDYSVIRPHTAHGELSPAESPPPGPSTNPKPHSDWTSHRVPSHRQVRQAFTSHWQASPDARQRRRAPTQPYDGGR